MTDEFIKLKDSQDSDAVFCVVVYVVPMIISLKYKHKGMSYGIDLPRTKYNAHLKKGDEVEMQLFIMKEIKDDV